MISASDALARLREGNRRFVNGASDIESAINRARRAALVDGQSPFAIVLACSDSRVPVELVFDQGLGDLFVIRVAGNIVAPSQVGSVEFAAKAFGTRLVVVLGHTRCGAVVATLEDLSSEAKDLSPNLRVIVERVRDAVAPVHAKHHGDLSNDVVREAVIANVRASAEALRHGSPLLEELIGAGELAVVGAKYSISTGEVEFLDDQQ